jgi:hypothetical protein
MTDFVIAQNDTLPALTATLLSAGSLINLTGVTVTFSMSTVLGRQVITDRPCTVSSAPTSGVVTLFWQTGDTTLPGSYLGQFIITSSQGVQHVPNGGYIEILIRPSLP